MIFDRDNGELVFRQQFAPPHSVLLLRVRSYRPIEPAEWIASLYAAESFLEGHFHIFDGHTIRRRALPQPIAPRKPA